MLTQLETHRLAHETDARERAFLWLGLGAGLRVGEICGLKRSYIASDLSIEVPKKLAKSDRTRRVYLSQAAKLYLQLYLDQVPHSAPDEPLFPSRTGGGHMKPSWGSRYVQAIFQRCGITGASSHSLRRTHANGLRLQGSDILVIKQQLGHASIQTTEEYLELMPAEQPEEVERLVV
jgi:integrase/recombinase XerD